MKQELSPETVTGTETETETETTTEITDIGQDELTGADVQESTVQGGAVR